MQKNTRLGLVFFCVVSRKSSYGFGDFSSPLQGLDGLVHSFKQRLTVVFGLSYFGNAGL